jgi:hypothetical protein
VILYSSDLLKLKLCLCLCSCFCLCFRFVNMDIGEPRLLAQQGGWMATKEQLIRMNNKLCRGNFLPPFTNMGNYKMGTPDPHDDLGPHNVEFWVSSKITKSMHFWDNRYMVSFVDSMLIQHVLFLFFCSIYLFLVSLLSLARISFSPAVKSTAICRE